MNTFLPRYFLLRFLAVFALFTGISNVSQGQLLKKLGDKAKNAANKMLGEKEEAKPDEKKETPTEPAKESKSNMDLYGSYDFVPGDSILFSDDLENEEANEIPSRWLLVNGRAEIISKEGENLISARGGTSLRPRMKERSYLPKRFTIEFDIKYTSYAWQYGRNISLTLANPAIDSNQEAGAFGTQRLLIRASGDAAFGNAKGQWPEDMRKDEVHAVLKEWKHVAISVNEKSVKVYINQNRILNAQLEYANPSSLQFTIENDYDAPVLIKHFRVLAGGKNPAKQITTENEFIARGIQFEKASPVLLPESMGEINRLVNMMKENTGVHFEIGGHTSAEAGGNAEANLRLSGQRANTVKEKMIALGIDGSRLTAEGFGQTQPIGDNQSPEGRASNRRVVFKKIK